MRQDAPMLVDSICCAGTHAGSGAAKFNTEGNALTGKLACKPVTVTHSRPVAWASVRQLAFALSAIAATPQPASAAPAAGRGMLQLDREQARRAQLSQWLARDLDADQPCSLTPRKEVPAQLAGHVRQLWANMGYDRTGLPAPQRGLYRSQEAGSARLVPNPGNAQQTLFRRSFAE